MKMVHPISLALICLIFACNSAPPSFDIQGHRGARGYLPENTIPSFHLALEQGATTLELDLALSADTQLIISHEPWLSPEICLDSLGNPLSGQASHHYNLFKMDYSTIQKFDCGLKTPASFPNQTSLSISKPLLSHLLDSLARRSAPVPINVEIKSRPEWDSFYYPSPEFIVDHLLSLLSKYDYQDLTTIQSFDIRPLNYLQSKNIPINVSLLVSESEDPEVKLKEMIHKPHILSPHHQLVDADLRRFTREQNILLIPWTVNDTSRMSQLIKLEVDGIITDYPDRLVEMVNEYKD